MIDRMAGRFNFNDLEVLLREALTSVFKRNARQRRLSFFLWLSILGFVGAGVWGVQKGILRWQESRIPTLEQKQASEKESEAKRQKEYLENLGKIQANLGVFQFSRSDVQPRPPGSALPPSIMMDLTVRCNSIKTCDWIRENKNLVRNEVLREVRPITQEDALTVDGKKRLKKRILQRLNQWMQEGELDELYFSKVMVQ